MEHLTLGAYARFKDFYLSSEAMAHRMRIDEAAAKLHEMGGNFHLAQIKRWINRNLKTEGVYSLKALDTMWATRRQIDAFAGQEVLGAIHASFELKLATAANTEYIAAIMSDRVRAFVASQVPAGDNFSHEELIDQLEVVKKLAMLLTKAGDYSTHTIQYFVQLHEAGLLSEDGALDQRWAALKSKRAPR